MADWDITDVNGSPLFEKREWNIDYSKESPCACCGKPVKGVEYALTKFGGKFASADEYDDDKAAEDAWVGFLPVGSDCARRLRKAGIKTAKLDRETGYIE